jgi:ABC-type lipoprotein release transport system permease subunit
MHTLERPATNGRVSTVILEPARRRPRWWFVAAAVAVVVAIVVSVVAVRSRAAAVTYTTVPVQTGSLAQTVTASGTLNPQNTINVGTQVSGTISEIDADFNAHVRKGQVLAKLDPASLQAALDQARSAIATAQANVTKAQSALVLAQQTVAREIGIMNIMLVSVTERTREIGLRVSLGARGAAILRQFLIEAVVLSTGGGALGVVLGVAGAAAIAMFAHSPASVPLTSVLLALAFSAAVGVFFGYWPARKAAALDPIRALRFE